MMCPHMGATLLLILGKKLLAMFLPCLTRPSAASPPPCAATALSNPCLQSTHPCLSLPPTPTV